MGEGTSLRSKAIPLQQESVHFELYIILLVPIEWNCSRISNCLFVWVDDCRRVANGCLLFLSIVKMRPLWFWVLCVWIGWWSRSFWSKKKACVIRSMLLSKSHDANFILEKYRRISYFYWWSSNSFGWGLGFLLLRNKITQRQPLPPAVQKQSRCGLNAAGVHRDVSDSWLKIKRFKNCRHDWDSTKKFPFYILDACMMFFLLFQKQNGNKDYTF